MMALPQIVSRNQTQKITTIAINVRRVLSPFDFYTCPAGKKAVVKGTANCDNLGAATAVDLNGAGVIIHTWDTGTNTDWWAGDTQANTLMPFEIQLDAGETVDYSQNSGTNASMDFFAKVEETPA